MEGNHSLKRTEMLKGHLRFETIKRKTRPIRGKWLVVNISPNNLGINKIGISISSQRVLKSSRRNRLKRLIKEAHRLHKNELKKGFDIVVRSTTMKESPNFKTIEKELLEILRKGGILR